MGAMCQNRTADTNPQGLETPAPLVAITQGSLAGPLAQVDLDLLLNCRKNAGHFLLQLLTRLKFHHRPGRNRHVFTWVFGVSPDLGFRLANFESAEISHNHRISLRQVQGDGVEGLLNHVKHLLLR